VNAIAASFAVLVGTCLSLDLHRQRLRARTSGGLSGPQALGRVTGAKEHGEHQVPPHDHLLDVNHRNIMTRQ